MKISEIIFSCEDKFGITDVIREKEITALGLSSADLDMPYCTFIDNEKYLEKLSRNAEMIITTSKIAQSLDSVGICISENPRVSFFRLHNYLANKDEYIIHKNFETQIGNGCSISNLASIAEKNVKIGNNVVIEEFVSIKENTIIEDNTIIRAGSIIGSEGYEFKRISKDEILQVKHAGWTWIGKSVEIQCNTCIDKAIYPWDRTLIGDNCKIDNLIHVAHGVKLGTGVFLVAGALIGGRTVIKDNTWIGVGAIISNGLIIGSNAKVNIGSVATRDVEDNASVTGNFAIEHSKFIQFIKSIR